MTEYLSIAPLINIGKQMVAVHRVSAEAKPVARQECEFLIALLWKRAKYYAEKNRRTTVFPEDIETASKDLKAAIDTIAY